MSISLFFVIIGAYASLSCSFKGHDMSTPIDKFRHFKIEIPQYDKRMSVHGVPFIPRKLNVGILLRQQDFNSKILSATLQEIDTGQFNVFVGRRRKGENGMYPLGFKYDYFVNDFHRGMSCDSLREDVEILTALHLDILLLGNYEDYVSILSSDDCKKLNSDIAQHIVLVVTDRDWLSAAAEFALYFLNVSYVFSIGNESESSLGDLFYKSVVIFYSSQFTNFWGSTSTGKVVLNSSSSGPVDSSLLLPLANVWDRLFHLVAAVSRTGMRVTGQRMDIRDVELLSCQVYLSERPSDMYVRTEYG
jgi:hypothetical protein